MDKRTFEKEIVRLVKDHRRQFSPSLPSDEQRRELQSNVYTYIDSLYPTESGNSTSLTLNRRPGKLDKIKDYVKNIFNFDGIARSFVAFAAVSSIAFGVLTLQFTGKSPSPLFNLPDSIAAEIPYNGNLSGLDSAKSFIDSQDTSRRMAFVTGIARAEYDLGGHTNHENAQTINSNVNQFSANEFTNLWLFNGYAVEVVHLAALRAIEDIDLTVIESALKFYRETSSLPTEELSTDDPALDQIPSLFLQHHQFLMSVDTSAFAPSDIQNVIDISEQMKVVLR